MPNIVTTVSITLTVATRAMALSRGLALRETSQVSIAASDGSTFPTGKTYQLLAMYDGTLIASNAALTGAGTATLTGEFDLNTTEAIAAFGTVTEDMPDLYPVVLELWNSTDGLKLGIQKVAVVYNPYSAGMSTPTSGAITDYLTESAASLTYLRKTDASNLYEPLLGNPAATAYTLYSSLGGARYWAASAGAAVTSVFGRTGSVGAVANDYSATQVAGLGTAAVANTGTGATQVILGNDARLTDSRTPTAHASAHRLAGGTDILLASQIGGASATDLASHTGNTSNPHTVTAAQAGAPALSLLTAAGGLFRASSSGVAAQILPMTGLGNLTGAAAPTLTPRGMHSATVSGNITGWTIAGLANGENAGILLRNPSYSVAVTGLTGWPGFAATSMEDIAVNGAILLIQRAGATYYGVA
jgi:hypothetical protein